MTVGYSKDSKKPNGINIARSISALQVITGNVGILGGTIGDSWQGGLPGFGGHAHPSGTVTPSISIGSTPGTFTLPISPAGTGALFFNTNVLQTLILNRAELDAGQITVKEYQNRIGNLPTNPVPNVHMAFIAREINQFSNSKDSVKAVGLLDMAVCITDNMMRPSARSADILLPTTAGVGEAESSFNMFHNAVFYTPHVCTPPGEVRTSTWISQQLANALGYGAQYSSSSTERHLGQLVLHLRDPLSERLQFLGNAERRPRSDGRQGPESGATSRIARSSSSPSRPDYMRSRMTTRIRSAMGLHSPPLPGASAVART